MQLIKKFVGLFSIIALLSGLFVPNLVAAQSKGVVSPKASPAAAQISSFELFWPIVAGKTMDEPWYFLKSFKENLRGMLIFGSPQKADYELLLATKRVVEAEKLINGGKTDYANKTLEIALQELGKSSLDLDKALSLKVSFQEQALNMTNKLSNLEVFIPWLMTQSEKSKENLGKVLEKVSLLSEKLQ